MELKLNIGFEQLLNLVNQLPEPEKEKLIIALKSKNPPDNIVASERQLGKYGKKIRMTDDFNEPLEDFNEYMP